MVKENGKYPRDMDGNDLTAYGYLTLWSDAFITAWVKQKDNSVWCLIVTFAAPNDNNR